MLRLDMDTEDVLLANSSALAERRAQAMEELRPGQFIDASDLDEALETKSAPSDGRREPDST
jgi:hypothetical protein